MELGTKDVGFAGGAFVAITYHGEIYSCSYSSILNLIKISDSPKGDYIKSQCFIVVYAGEIFVVSKKFYFSDDFSFMQLVSESSNWTWREGEKVMVVTMPCFWA